MEKQKELPGRDLDGVEMLESKMEGESERVKQEEGTEGTRTQTFLIFLLF